MKTIDFVKMAASGNDFVVIDNSVGQLPVAHNSMPELVRGICRRKLSVGADGVLLLEDSQKGDIKMRIFNPDGSEVDMCGNGARCAALLAKSIEHRAKSKINIETRAGIIEAEVISKDKVKIKLTSPKDMRLNLNLSLGESKLDVHYINTGVPHAVSFTNDLDSVDVKRLGVALRYHREFQPQGTNTDFVRVIDPGNIRVRTYERGVEDETLACGTGAVAGALIAYRLALISQNQVGVKTKSGEMLNVYFDAKDNKFDNVWLEGEARIVYNGRYNYV